MHAHPLGRRVPRLIHVLSLAALVAICCSATAIAASSKSHPKPKPKTLSLAGKWKGQYSGAFSGTFTLHWTQSGSKLTGSIKLSNPKGTYAVGGRLHGSTITFGAVAAGATYTGKASAKSMSGTYKSPKGGGSWSAHKTS